MPIDVVVSPATWAVESLVRSTASRLAVDSALSCVVVRPWAWVVLSAPNCVVDRLSERRGGQAAELRRRQRIGLRGGEGLDLGRGQRADLVGRAAPRPGWWSACRPGSSVRLPIAVVSGR